ncbi:hypothetical protein PV410_33975 [Streptomyces sp. PA03-5A]|nr:hypothetical protein [Streptomyces sp. PA03-5A]
MSSPFRPGPSSRLRAVDVNELIRRLMDEPAGERRTLEYQRLLGQWAEVTRAQVVKAA